MSYSISIPYSDTTLVVNCKCGTESLLTWCRQVLKGWDHGKAVSRNIHARMRPAIHGGMIYGNVLFVVRDPVHRFVSCYYNKIGNADERRYFRKGVTLHQWSEMLLTKKYRFSNEHWIPQSHMLPRIHDQRKMRLVPLPDVEKFLQQLMRRAEAPCPSLVNDSTRNPRRYDRTPEELVNEEILGNLRRAYREDFILFDRAKLTPLPQRV